MSNSKEFIKGIGCLGAIFTLLTGILLGYLNLRYGWGLEVKNWLAYIGFGVLGTVSSFVMAHVFADMMKG